MIAHFVVVGMVSIAAFVCRRFLTVKEPVSRYRIVARYCLQSWSLMPSIHFGSFMPLCSFPSYNKPNAHPLCCSNFEGRMPCTFCLPLLITAGISFLPSIPYR